MSSIRNSQSVDSDVSPRKSLLQKIGSRRPDRQPSQLSMRPERQPSQLSMRPERQPSQLSMRASSINGGASISDRSSLFSFSMSVNTTNDFQLEKPKDENLIELMFDELMSKRDFQNFPDTARKQMMNWDIDKKWMLIHQDALAEYQNEVKCLFIYIYIYIYIY